LVAKVLSTMGASFALRLSNSRSNEESKTHIGRPARVKGQIFNYIMTVDESQFVCLYHSDHMFASGREDVIPREKQAIGVHKVMLTIFSAKQV
jgi:hypothetical protein